MKTEKRTYFGFVDPKCKRAQVNRWYAVKAEFFCCRWLNFNCFDMNEYEMIVRCEDSFLKKRKNESSWWCSDMYGEWWRWWFRRQRWWCVEWTKNIPPHDTTETRIFVCAIWINDVVQLIVLSRVSNARYILCEMCKCFACFYVVCGLVLLHVRASTLRHIHTHAHIHTYTYEHG